MNSIKKIIPSLFTLSLTLSCLALEPASPVQFMGNFLYLKSMMPCQIILLAPMPTDSAVSPFIGVGETLYLKLVEVDALKPGNMRTIQEMTANGPFPSYQIFFDSAGGPASTKHYQLYAEKEIPIPPRVQTGVTGPMPSRAYAPRIRVPISKYFRFAYIKHHNPEDCPLENVAQGAMIKEIK